MGEPRLGLMRADLSLPSATPVALPTPVHEPEARHQLRLRGRLRVCRLPGAPARANGQQLSAALARVGALCLLEHSPTVKPR